MNEQTMQTLIDTLRTTQVGSDDYFSKIKAILSGDRENYIHNLQFTECLYELLRHLSENQIDVADKFDNPFDREELIRSGETFIDNGNYDKAWLFVNSFKNDTYRNERLTNLVQSEDPNSTAPITTPSGTLAWFVQKLVIKSHNDQRENLLKAFTVTKEMLSLLTDYYLISQWLIPLVEIAKRRLWLLIEDQENTRTYYYHELKELLFNNQHGLIQRYHQNNLLSRLIIHSINYIRELNTRETEYMLNKLNKKPEFEVLLVYFAIFREHHYIRTTDNEEHTEIVDMLETYDPTILQYNPAFAKSMLTDLLEDQNLETSKYQGNIIWNFYHILKQDQSNFIKLEEYLDTLFSLPYKRDVVINLRMIFKEFPYQQHPDKFKIYLNSLLDTCIENQADIRRDHLSHWYLGEEILNKVRQVSGTEEFDEIQTKFEILRSS